MALAAELSFPLIRQNSEMSMSVGTASYIGSGVFLTAGHCIHDVAVDELSVIIPSDTGENDYMVVALESTEVLDFDLGIFTLTEPVSKRTLAKTWTVEKPSTGTEIMITGYPITSLSKDFELDELYPRTFRTALLASRISKDVQKKPIVHELDGFCPKGVSGTAVELMVNVIAGKRLQHYPRCGIYVATKSSSIELMRSKEEEKVDGKTVVTFITKEDAFHFGIAVSAENFVNVMSTNILSGKTLFDHLNQCGLLV